MLKMEAGIYQRGYSDHKIGKLEVYVKNEKLIKD